MTECSFVVADEVFDRFPNYVVGWVAARWNPETIDVPSVDAVLRASEERIRTVFAGKDLKEHPGINVWRSSFSSLGWSASKYPSSVEALIKRVARGGELPSINPAVDLVNAVSLTYVVPVGCHDLDRTNRLEVRPAQDGDVFLPMGDAASEAPDRGEIIYASADQVRTRRWVWRQSRDALVTYESSWIFVPVDGFRGATASNVEAAVSYLASAFGTHFNAKVSSGLVDSDSPEAAIPHLEIHQ